MKTITIDFDLYKKELQEAYENGQNVLVTAIPEAVELFNKVLNYDIKREEIYKWIRKYTVQNE